MRRFKKRSDIPRFSHHHYLLDKTMRLCHRAIFPVAIIFFCLSSAPAFAAQHDWIRCYLEVDGKKKWFEAIDDPRGNTFAHAQVETAFNNKIWDKRNDLQCVVVNNPKDERKMSQDEFVANTEVRSNARDAAIKEHNALKASGVSECQIASGIKKNGPFDGLSGSEYLNAIYAKDRETISCLDREYFSQARNFVKGHPLGSLLTSFIDSATYVNAVLRTYVEAYDSHYARCLRKDASSFTVRTTETRGGVETKSSDKIVRVNKEFAAVYEKLGPDQPLTGGVLIGDLLTGSYYTKVTIGTEQLMNRFGCDDPKLKQFERNLVEVYASRP